MTGGRRRERVQLRGKLALETDLRPAGVREPRGGRFLLRRVRREGEGVTFHLVCHDRPIELVTPVERFARDLARQLEREGRDVSLEEVS